MSIGAMGRGLRGRPDRTSVHVFESLQLVAPRAQTRDEFRAGQCGDLGLQWSVARRGRRPRSTSALHRPAARRNQRQSSCSWERMARRRRRRRRRVAERTTSSSGLVTSKCSANRRGQPRLGGFDTGAERRGSKHFVTPWQLQPNTLHRGGPAARLATTPMLRIVLVVSMTVALLPLRQGPAKNVVLFLADAGGHPGDQRRQSCTATARRDDCSCSGCRTSACRTRCRPTVS